MYLLGAVVGGVVIAVKASVNPKPGVSLGASAAISALLTCALVLLYRPSAARFGQATWVRLTLWAVLLSGLAASLLPGVSLAGHVAGLITGALVGFWIPVGAQTDSV